MSRRLRSARLTVMASACYDLWLRTWETTLAALPSTIQSRSLSPSEIAAHKAAINFERKVVSAAFAPHRRM
jgi:hypothetical protein